MTKNDIKLRKMNSGLTSWMSFFTAVIIVFMGLIFTSMIPIAQADSNANGQGLPSPVDIVPINKAAGIYHAPVCPELSKDAVRCHAHVVVDKQGNPTTNTALSPYTPIKFLGAYGLSGTTSSNQIIAIVDAYDDPTIASDLLTYSGQFGIPINTTNCQVSSFTGSKPCFQKVNQNGGNTSYPPVNSGWALEISLDVEIAHAICQNCNILLVEANSNSWSDLMSAIDQAAKMNATVISNSWGAGEFSSETSLDNHLNHSGIAITFSSGDSGYGVQYPAASQYVTAVGGTTLYLNGNSYGSENAWSGAGSGCSAYETTKPTGQPNLGVCSNRIVADVSADADPNTGAAIYDTTRYLGHKGWFDVGGTSLASPIIAGVYALAGGAELQRNSVPYIKAYNYASNAINSNLHDIIGGSNGSCGVLNPLCNAVSGYDGPTGLGTPSGTGAFS